MAGWAAGWQAGAGRESHAPGPTPSLQADEFAADFSYKPKGMARVSQGQGGMFIISKQLWSCNHLFLDLERAGGQRGGREKARRRQGGYLQAPACKATLLLDELLPPSTQTSPTPIHIYKTSKKNAGSLLFQPQSPYCAVWGLAGAQESAWWPCLQDRSPSASPCSRQGTPTATICLSIPVSLPLPCVSGQDRKTDREKHLRGGEKPICFGFPVAPSLGSAQAV